MLEGVLYVCTSVQVHYKMYRTFTVPVPVLVLVLYAHIFVRYSYEYIQVRIKEYVQVLVQYGPLPYQYMTMSTIIRLQLCEETDQAALYNL